MRALILAAAFAAAACGGAAVAPSPSPTAPTHIVSGTLTFIGDTVGQSDCHGVGGYADMIGGTDILVLDGANATIGKADLSEGTGFEDGCMFTFRAEGVPDEPFYTFRIGDRDAPTYSNAEMVEQNWDVELSVGK